MKWILIESESTIQEIEQNEGISLIFKHSPRCKISTGALEELEEKSAPIPAETRFYFLNVVEHKDLSRSIAEKFAVKHESPQMLLIKGGACFYENSHHDISADDAAVQIILAEDNA